MPLTACCWRCCLTGLLQVVHQLHHHAGDILDLVITAADAKLVRRVSVKEFNTTTP